MELMMMLLLFLFFFIPFFLLSKFLSSPPRSYKNLPPSPPSLPIIGHLHLFKKPIHQTLLNISNNYGPILYLRFGSRPVLVISSPSAAEECLTKNDIIFANRPRMLIGKHMGNNYTTLVTAPYGDHWRNLRRITSLEIFSTNRLQMFSYIRTDEVRLMMKRLVNYADGKVEIKSMLFELTLNIMMRMVADKRYYGENVVELEHAMRFKEMVTEAFSLGGVSNIDDFLPVLRWFGRKGSEKRMVRLKNKRNELLQELIEERKRLRNSPSVEMRMTLIDVLLSLQETEPQYYTDKIVQGIIWVMFSAGTDTSAGTLEWALSLLLNNPDVLKKAQAEIDANVEQGRLLDESDINKLPYLQSIISETLRMYPATTIIPPHESSQDCVIGGYNVPRGTMLLVNLWAIQNDPNLWDEPSKFKPERFDGLKGVRDGFKLMPFGSGRRGCPGEGLAMHVVGLSLGSLIQCFNWERVGDEMVDMSAGSGITNPKALPLEAKCRPRSHMLNLLS